MRNRGDAYHSTTFLKYFIGLNFPPSYKFKCPNSPIVRLFP